MAVNYFQISDEQRQRLLYPQTTTPVQNNGYNVIGQKAATQTVNNQNQGGFLEGLLGQLGKSAENVGKGIYGMIGGGIASAADLLTGNTNKSYDLDTFQKMIDANKKAGSGNVQSLQNALDLAKQNGWDRVRGYLDDNGAWHTSGEGKNATEFKNSIWGTDDRGITNYAKTAGESLDAAATLSNFIPGANGLVGNTLQGAAGAFGQTYADTGGDLESALKSAAAGGAAGLATGGLNVGLNKTLAKGGKLANFATKHPLLNTAARGAVSGAVGGGVGGGTAAALNGGDIMASAAAGAGQGTATGLTAAPVMYGANKVINKLPGLKQTIGGAQTALNEMDQDYQNARANGQRYYGFGSDNKAETAPGSIRNTYVAGDIVEGAEKAGRYAIDKAKNPMLGMGLKDVSNDSMTWGQQDIANTRNRNLDKIDTVIEEGEFSDWGGTKNNPLFKKLVKSGALVANPADPDDTFEGSYITNPNRTLTNEEMHDIAQLLREEGYGGIDKNGKYNSDLDLNLEEMPQVSPDQTSFFEGQNMAAKNGKLADINQLLDEQERKYWKERNNWYDNLPAEEEITISNKQPNSNDIPGEDTISNRIKEDSTFKRILERPDSAFNSDVMKQIGAKLSSDDLDMYKRALSGGVLSREEIQNSGIAKKFREYGEQHKNETIINDTQEKAALKDLENGVKTKAIDEQTMARLQNTAREFMANDKSLANAVNNGEAAIVLGMPASGKSSNAVDKFIKEGYFNLDNDEIKKLFPEYNQGLGAGNVHNASSYIATGLVLPEVAKNKTNIVIPVIGKGLNSLDKYAKILKDAGYGKISLVNVDLPLDKTATRNFTRMLETSRNVDMDYIYEVVGNKPTENYNLIKERIKNGTEPSFTDYASISTDVPFGTEAKVLENSGGVRLWGEPNEGLTGLTGNNGRSSGSLREGMQTARQLGANGNPDVPVNPDLMYGESELAGRTAAQNRGNMLQRLGEIMEGAQSNTTRVQNRKIGVKSAGNAIDKVYKKTGISDLDVQAELAKELTGGQNSYLDQIQRNALSATEDGTTRTVDTSEVVAKVEPLVDSMISETNLTGNKRRQFINSLRRDIQTGDTITAANRLKEQAQVLFDKKENMIPLDKQQAKVYRELGKELDDLSYKAVPADNVEAMFEAAVSESRGRAKQAQSNGNTSIANAYNKIADTLEKSPKTIQAFRSFKKDFVDVAKMGELSALGEQAVLAQNGANLTGNIKRFVNKALQKPTNQALAWAGSKISDYGESLGNKPTQTPTTAATTNQAVDLQNPTNLFNLIGQKQGSVAAENTLEGQLANMNTEPASQALSTGLEGNYYSGSDVYGNATAPTTYGASQTAQASTGNSMLSRIENGIQNALNAGDFESVEYLIDMYNNLAKVYSQNEQKQTKITATQQRANAAMNSLQRIAQMQPDTGYALSGIPLIGDIATLGGNAYQSEAQSLAQQIGYMVSGANIKKEEAEAIGKAYVPQPFDSEETRNLKLQRAAEIIQQYQNGYAE